MATAHSTQHAPWGLACEGVQIAAHRKGALLTQVQARVRPGCLTAIVGPNGAGKSTLLATLCGSLAPRAGAVHWDGVALAARSSAERARHMAVMHQDTQLAFAFTVQEVVDMGRYPHRQHPLPDEAAVVGQAMERTGVAHLAQREVASLSGGERARVHLARALAQLRGGSDAPACSRWLLLDEPTAALDLLHQHQTMGLVQQLAHEEGVGVVVVLHDLNLALRYAHDVLLVPGQGAAAVLGPTHAVLTLPTLERIWGVRGSLLTDEAGHQQLLVQGLCPTPCVA